MTDYTTYIPYISGGVGMENPFFSKAIFSWNVPGVDGGDPIKFADRLKTAGFEAVYLKMANGAYVFRPNSFTYPLWGENVRQALIDALRLRGIKVIGWQFNFGDNIAGEAAIAVAQSKRFNVDGWVFDVEGKFESNISAVANAYALTNAYRAALPTMPLAFCSWAQWKSPTGAPWHNENMASAFMSKCDVGMPMMYWSGTAASNALWLLNESTRLWQNITNKPIIPAGRAYSGDGGYIDATAIKAFADAVRAKGQRGLSWWVLDTASKNSAAWGALASIAGFEQVVTPPATETGALRFEVIRAMNMRAGPGTEFADVGDLATGQIITATNVGGGNSWIEFAPGKWAALDYNGVTYLKKA